jgi:hypothetical protein
MRILLSENTLGMAVEDDAVFLEQAEAGDCNERRLASL